jgi:hypothetical protein
MSDEQLRRAFLERAAPDPKGAQEYRRKVEAMIQERERWLRQEHRMTVVVGMLLVLVSTALLLVGGLWFEGQLKGVWLGVNACFWFLFAAMLMLRHTMVRHRVELLKELKGIEMRVIEIQERLGKA